VPHTFKGTEKLRVYRCGEANSEGPEFHGALPSKVADEVVLAEEEGKRACRFCGCYVRPAWVHLDDPPCDYCGYKILEWFRKGGHFYVRAEV
jgi:hypothetical protein